jgi:hypothetical protein
MSESTPQKTKSVDPSIMDLKISWKIYKANAKPFIGYSFFAFLGSFFFTFLLSLFVFYLVISIYVELQLEVTLEMIYIIALVFAVPTLFLSFALMGSVYGLAYDILSSGDEFAEIKGAFTYFKRYGWQYCVLTLLSAGINLFFSIFRNYLFDGLFFDNIVLHILCLIGIYFLSNCWTLLFCMSFPSLTAHGSLKKAIKESVALFKTNTSRIFKSVFMWFFFFSLPVIIALELVQYYEPIWDISNLSLLIIFTAVVYIIDIAIGNPIYVLMLTRIYNTSQITKDQAPKEKKVTLEPRF